MLLQDASFAWATQAAADEESHADTAKRPGSAPERGWALGQSQDVLRELSLAIPQGSLTAIVGDIGSGEHAFMGACISVRYTGSPCKILCAKPGCQLHGSLSVRVRVNDMWVRPHAQHSSLHDAASA